MNVASLSRISATAMLVLALVALVLSTPAEAAPKTSLSASTNSLPAAGGLVTLKYSVGVGVRTCSLEFSAVGSPTSFESIPCHPKTKAQSVGPLTLSSAKSSSPTVWVFTLTAVSANSQSRVSTSIIEAGVADFTYVALGDSLASGGGSKASGWLNFNGKPDNSLTANDQCNRSPVAYPQLVNAGLSNVPGVSLPKVTFSFLACSGSTTSDLDPDSPARRLGLAGRSGSHGERAQLLDIAELHHARIVTLSAGANDVGFRAFVSACSLASDGCAALPMFANFEKSLETLRTTLETVFGDLRVASPNAAIYAVGYPSILPLPGQLTPSELSKGCGGLTGGSLTALATIQEDLNQTIEQAASAAGISYVDPSGFLVDPANTSASVKGSGHTLCSPTSRWINPLVKGSTIALLPTSLGQASLAQSVLAEIQSTQAAVPLPSAPTTVGVKSVVASDTGYCAIVISGGVDCWGTGLGGELGNGKFYLSGNYGSAVPVAVTTTSGLGTLTGVKSLASSGTSFCALLTSGGVDCWGHGVSGALGNGKSKDSAIPVVVASITGLGALSGVVSLASSKTGYCALLASGGVDCWGPGTFGELGNGVFTRSPYPTAVVSTSGASTLTGVIKLVGGTFGYCALLSSDGVDCWGSGSNGELGNGQFANSAIPAVVTSTSGQSSLSGAANLTSSSFSYCAILNSGGVDCWGSGFHGELGSGTFSRSAIPVAVVSTSGTSSLAGVVSLTNNSSGYCALMSSGGVDCWGSGEDGELGNGAFNRSAIPVVVVSTLETSTLTGVTNLFGGSFGYCALLAAGGVDCWGIGLSGAIGNGLFNSSAIPSSVLSPSGPGNLSGVASITSGSFGYCALLTSGGLVCWGSGLRGELGNGQFANSATPAVVFSTS